MLTAFRFSLLHPKRPTDHERGTEARGDW